MRIHFYMPEDLMPRPEVRNDWLAGRPPRLEQAGKAACAQCWIYLTYARLLNSGLPVALTHRLPEEGVVIALTGNIPPNYRAPENAFMVGVAADGTPHPAAHFHVLQNNAHARRLARSIYIPLWSQPGLVPRRAARGGRLETLAFFGDPPNLAPELASPTFAKTVKDRFGLTFFIAGAEHWHDYSDVDCVLAIREFSDKRFLRKPATKLYNAWLAGVPFLGGRDSAFAADGRPGIDFLACENPEQLFEALGRLKAEPAFRESLVRNGSESARRFTDDAITGRWCDFLGLALQRAASDHAARGRISRSFHGWTHRKFVGWDHLQGH